MMKNLLNMTKVEEIQKRSKEFWDGRGQENIYKALYPVFNSVPEIIKPMPLISIESRPGLSLLPGSIDFAYESELAIAQAVRGSLSTQRNLPGAINALIKRTVDENDIDYVLIDLGPSLGAINQNIVSISDFIIVPCSPDYFSLLALDSLTTTFLNWYRNARDLSSTNELTNATYPFPEPGFKILATTISRYTIYKGSPSNAFQFWIDRLETFCNNIFIPKLDEAGLIPNRIIKNPSELTEFLIRDYNSLRPKSQEFAKPPFALTDEEIGLNGNALSNTDRMRKESDSVFDRLATRVETA